MGIIRDSILRARKPVAVSAPVNVGTADASLRTAATLIEKVDGEWRYGDEKAIDVWLLKHHEVPLSEDEALLWTGMEVRVEKAWDTQGWHLAVALVNPDSQNFFWDVPFKPARNRAAGERMRRLAAELNKARTTPAIPEGLIHPVRSESGLPEALRRLSFDPFETDSNYLTARMPDPLRCDWSQLQSAGEGYAVAHDPRRRNSPKKRKSAKGLRAEPKWSFGVCASFPQALAETIQKVQEQADQLFNLPRRPVTGPHSSIVENEADLVAAAVRYALAGRIGTGDSVAKRAIRIFREWAENRTKHFDPPRR